MALGHAAAVAVAVGVAALIGVVVPAAALRWGVVAILFGFGAWKLVRHRHPRYGGMRVTSRQLAIWSFLMASAHGAGLMVLPLVLDDAPAAAATVHSGHAGHGHGATDATNEVLRAGLDFVQSRPVAATVVHTLAYLLVTGVIALAVQAWFGLRFLRVAWVNIDLLWAGALIVTALVTAVHL
jgi:hypothetical protein